MDSAGNEIEAMNTLINPGIPIPERITKITGIKDEDVAGQPLFKDIAERLRPLFAAADCLIAHNLPFDSNIMKLELNRARLMVCWPWPGYNLCTVQEHAEEWGRRPKLTELYEMYMGKPLAQSHRAIDDVKALKEVCMAAGVIR